MTMRTVHKFLLTVASGDVMMPRGARILRVCPQQGAPRLWAEVDTDQPLEARRFTIVGTGQPIETGEYVGTYDSPPYVWHVYDVTAPAANGWTEWHGGDEPPEDARGKVVNIRRRDLIEYRGPAAAWFWGRDEEEYYDIVAYRIATDQA
jgi:hypothetical protein